MVSAPDYVALQARLRPDHIAARNLATDETWSYAAFDQAIAGLNAALRLSGIAAGDRITVIAKNCAELVMLHLACARLGAIYVPLNWRLAAPELQALIEDAAPKLQISDPAFDANTNAITLAALLDLARNTAPFTTTSGADPDQPSLILYTSGTSGKPKGVLLTERNLEAQGRNFALLGQVTAQSVVLCDAPMFHTIGLVANIRPALMQGGSLLISDGFVPARTLTRLADPALGVTHYFCVPQMAAMLRADPSFDPTKLRRLTAIFSGGAPHAPASIAAWLHDGIPIADGFGMSETGTVSCMPIIPAAIERHAGAVGVIPPTISLRIIDENGNEAPPGGIGEVIVCGANVTSGYWRRPAETQAALTADGWLRTGDLGRMDQHGFLWLIDRKKDLIISGGENIYPAEIENALVACPGLAESAVIGVPDAQWGEVGHLFIVPLATTPCSTESVIAYLTPRLARYKIPKHVTLLDQLPRNNAGKLLKAALRQHLLDGHQTT